MTPQRIQLKRTRGWRMPPNTVKVDRTSRFGNPFRIDLSNGIDAEASVILYRNANDHPSTHARIRNDLRGKNLACWCPIWICKNGHKFGNEIKPSRVPKYCPKGCGILSRAPCHADVLLEIANK